MTECHKDRSMIRRFGLLISSRVGEPRNLKGDGDRSAMRFRTARKGPPMPDPTIRNLITDVLDAVPFDPSDVIYRRQCEQLATALLADPTFAAIIDVAANATFKTEASKARVSPEVRALLATWRTK